MKKLLVCAALVGLLVSAVGVTPALADVTSPTVSAINPISAPNDIGTSVMIIGTGFTAVMDASGTVVVTAPTASLGSTALTHVSWVDSSTLTALVPWGVNPGIYELMVVNPADEGTATMPAAFTVTQGIGNWNAGELFGGLVTQLLMKPGDPNTIYGLAYGVIGLFRSDDAGEHWAFVGDKAWANNNKFAVDRNNPDWLYAFAPNGLMRSMDKGDTWTTLMPNDWPNDGRTILWPQIYVSPHDPHVLFVSASVPYGATDTSPMGLLKSSDATEGGATFHRVTQLDGIPVQDVAFHPTDPSKMVLATSDGGVLQSADAGDTWSQVTTPPVTSLGARGAITYNPFKPSEVWFSSSADSGGIWKSTEPAFSVWENVTPAYGGGYPVTFTATDSVYVPRFHSIDGGTNWSPWGPSPWYGSGEVIFDPLNPLVGYIGDDAVGVRKTTDGGSTWADKVHGFTGLCCTTMDVSSADPLRVYATFNGPLGIYRSDDGTNHWTFLPIAGAWNVRQVVVDPINPQRVYVSADPGLFVSSDGGGTWSNLGWNGASKESREMPWAFAADPHTPGHLLVSLNKGNYGLGYGRLLSSDDYGASWHDVTLPPGTELRWIPRIVFDPDTTGTVYVATRGTGVFRSTDNGGTWHKISSPAMEHAESISIATHPQRMLIVGGDSAYSFRSIDDGATWQSGARLPSGGTDFMFADNDSTRMYFASPKGLFFSVDAGDSWEAAAGALGKLQVMAMRAAQADGHTILYAATPGGNAGTAAPSSAAAETRLRAPAATTPSNMWGAGIYRYVQVKKPTTLAISTRSTSSLAYGAAFTIKGTIRSSGSGVAGRRVILQSALYGSPFKDTSHVAVSTATGAFTFSERPKSKTSYRVRFAGSFSYSVAGPTMAIYALPRVRLTRSTSWSTLHRYRTYYARGYIEPKHSDSNKVRIRAYKKGSNGHYRYVKSFSASYSYYSSTKTRYKAAVRLTARGYWKLVAYHAADSKNAKTYGSADYVRVR